MGGHKLSPLEAGAWHSDASMDQADPKHMVAILHSPPRTSGSRTLARVALASRLLNCQSNQVVNLYVHDTNDVTDLNSESHLADWLGARMKIEDALFAQNTTDVLLGYGVQVPTGEGRAHTAEQLKWLSHSLAQTHCRVWTVGGRPTHPSRWQRVTHRERPGEEFVEALRAVLTETRVV